MSIPGDLPSKWNNALIESTDVANQTALAICAPDGSINLATTAAQSARTTGTITANGQTVLLEVEDFSIVTLTVGGTYSGLVMALEASADNITFYSIFGVDSATGVSAVTATPGTNGTKMYNMTLPGVTHFRVRATSFGSGTAEIGLIATSDPMVFNVSVNSVLPGSTAAALGKIIDAVAGASDTGVAALVVRKDILSLITPANGDYTRLLVDDNGALWVKHCSYTKTNITTATTTVVKSGSGIVRSIIINKAVASGVVTIYDSTTASGTLIGTITFGGTLLSDPPHQNIYDVAFNTGLTIVTSAAFDITVVYQ